MCSVTVADESSDAIARCAAPEYEASGATAPKRLRLRSSFSGRFEFRGQLELELGPQAHQPAREHRGRTQVRRPVRLQGIHDHARVQQVVEARTRA